MRPFYLQDIIFDENKEKLREVLGDRLHIFAPSMSGLNIPDEPGIVYASIPIARRAQKSGHFSLLPDNYFDYNRYSYKFKMLNDGWLMGVPEQIKRFVSMTGEAFVKDLRGYKTWTGRIIDETNLSDLDELYPDDILVFAPKKEIGAEYRIVIYNNEAVTGSVYLGEGDVHEALEFAQEQAVQADLDIPLYTIDVTTHDGEFRVVEVNSLLSAGWYDCDVRKIVECIDDYVS